MGNGTLGRNSLTGWDGVAQRCAFGILSRLVMGLGEVDAGRNLRDCETAHEDTKEGNRMRLKGRCAKKTLGHGSSGLVLCKKTMGTHGDAGRKANGIGAMRLRTGKESVPVRRI